jgi:hypothetical protein
VEEPRLWWSVPLLSGCPASRSSDGGRIAIVVFDPEFAAMVKMMTTNKVNGHSRVPIDART